MSNPIYAFGLIGHNIGYSRSPEVFDAIFAADDVEGSFELFDIEPESFDKRFNEILDSHTQAVSVTIPYKQRVIEYLNELDDAARTLGAVNSIALGRKRHGFNTDITGFAYPLENHKARLSNGRALVLGAGGAARAATYGLRSRFDIRRINIMSRTEATIVAARETLCSRLPDLVLQNITPQQLADNKSERWDIAVNATPLAGPNHPEESPLPDNFDWNKTGIYYDLNYNQDNHLLSMARDGGCLVFDGTPMLIAQAIESYRLWTGREVAFDSVFQKVFPDQSKKPQAR